MRGRGSNERYICGTSSSLLLLISVLYVAVCPCKSIIITKANVENKTPFFIPSPSKMWAAWRWRWRRPQSQT